MARTMYSRVLREWDWAAIIREAERSEPFSEFGEDPIRAAWLGTTMGVMPSGKIYAPWTSNVTQKEADRDESYSAALDRAAAKHGGFIFWSDDSCFFGVHAEDVVMEEAA